MYKRDKVTVLKIRPAIFNVLHDSVKLLGGLKLKGDEKIVIKPNVCNSKNPNNMVITDFRIIEAVINLVRSRAGHISVVESDNISGSAEKRMAESGLLQKLKELNVEFVNLSKDKAEIHDVDNIKIRLPKTVLNADYFINLPKIKTCGHTLVTLSIKNLFGLLQRARKNKLHRHLDKILPYLVKVVRQNLIVVDGIIAMEGNGPVIGTPKNLGIMVTGINPVAVDSICTLIMGFQPKEVKHLHRAHEIGLGEIDPNRIDVFGENWDRISRVFERPYSLKANIRSIRSIGKIYI